MSLLMKFHPSNLFQVTLVCFVLFLSFSCNKDSDLLAEYVVEKPQSFLVNDVVVTLANNPIVIAPLSNDTFKEPDKVAITEVTPPKMGTAVVNEDNTITYTPDTDQTGTDEFDYSTAVTNPDNSVSEETGSVTVTVTNKTPTEPTSPSDMGALKAFPGAEGFGKNTTGGRGGIVVEVTNLNDSGSGSLRSALSLKGKRTIVFKVAGNINLNSYLSIGPDNGDLTIAGQTAPGGGITIANHGIRIQGSNTIVRYVRFRPGNSADTGEDAVTIVAYSGRTTKNVILDHCSISWGKDENFNIGAIGGAGVNNVTLQNSIVAENIDTGYGVLLWSKATNISFHQNLLAHNKARNIRSSTCTSDFEFINNVVYSFGSGMQPTFENKFDIVGNVFISNPNVSKPSTLVKIEASTNNCPDGILSKTQAYLSDNTYDGSNISVESELKSYLENSKIFNSGISAIPNAQVKSTVLSKVGTSLYRDSLDERIIDDVNNRTGKIPGSAGGYPDLPKGTAYSDSDKDGMSNEWETVNGLNPNDAGDSNKDRDSDGYTNLEEYLHYLTKS
ncbi:hypothetical protein DHD32_13690 [Arenibacter sp. TNZ]|nr:hypothetical protein [Arenibacter sp. TNZ]